MWLDHHYSQLGDKDLQGSRHKKTEKKDPYYSAPCLKQQNKFGIPLLLWCIKSRLAYFKNLLNLPKPKCLFTESDKLKVLRVSCIFSLSLFKLSGSESALNLYSGTNLAFLLSFHL